MLRPHETHPAPTPGAGLSRSAPPRADPLFGTSKGVICNSPSRLPVLAQALASGIMLGGMFALISIGLTLIWGVMKIINFAHGEFLMLGLYVAYFMVADVHISPYLTFFVTIPAVALIGVVIFKATIDPILKDPVMNQIMLTLGLSLILQNVALVAFHADVLSVTTRWTNMNVHLGSVVIGVSQLICLVGSILATLGIWYFLQDNRHRALHPRRRAEPHGGHADGHQRAAHLLFAFALGSATLGFAGSLMIPFYYTSPTVGAFLGSSPSSWSCSAAWVTCSAASSAASSWVSPSPRRGRLPRLALTRVLLRHLRPVPGLPPQGVLSRRQT